MKNKNVVSNSELVFNFFSAVQTSQKTVSNSVKNYQLASLLSMFSQLPKDGFKLHHNAP